MTVNSFAQNFEDVLLWRALQHVAGGRYVDVGAGHPEHNSVTKLFYDAGWSGINIEPLPTLAEALMTQRPRDVNIRAAVSSREVETADFTVVDCWDELSTMSAERAEELKSEGRTVTTTKVPVVRLDEVLAAHALRDIHFLKVDVEGSELDVLQTLDLTQTRPWIVVVEVVSGNGDANSSREIRNLLEHHDYAHSYFDGLNDFYIADEVAEKLLPNFDVPVNVTDDFVRVSDSDRVMVELFAEKLGLALPAQASEVLQRVEAVVRDRISFEHRLNEVEALPPGGKAERDVLLEQVRTMDETIRGIRLKSEALEQTSFERERMVAWYAAEVSNYGYRGERQEIAYAEQAAAHAAREESQAANTEVQRRHTEDVQTRLDDVLASNSWRITLPIRVIRRPRTYLRELIHR